ncbi:MAG: hypothetical protein ACRDQA_09350 [Nocardioidaceae bacterium]
MRTPVSRRSATQHRRHALDAATADEHLCTHVHGTRQILERFASITKVIQVASATGPEVAALWRYDQDPPFVVRSAAAKALVAKPGAREEVSAEYAADLLYAVLSPELYLVFVRDRGWSPRAWEEWAYRTLRGQLCASWPAARDGQD